MRSAALSRPRRRLLSLFLGGLLLLFLAGQSPHLVHHLFEPAHNPDCVFASRADHTQGLPLDPGTLIFTPVPVSAICALNHPIPQDSELAPSDSRAPPLLAS